jgi:hypothetical protein
MVLPPLSYDGWLAGAAPNSAEMSHWWPARGVHGAHGHAWHVRHAFMDA